MKAMIVPVLFLFLFLQCSTAPTENDDYSGTGSETGNAIAGFLYETNGKTPAKDVPVSIRLQSTLADTSILGVPKRCADTATVTTDSNGYFFFDSTLDTGTYVIEADNGNNELALIDSIRVTNQDSTIIVSDTLKPAGAIKGIVFLSQGGDQRKVFILAFGIDRFARVETDGSFRFTNLAEGSYDLRLISSLDDYGVRDTNGISVHAGDTTDLDTLALPFEGIPSPDTFSILYDTLNQTVILSWSPCDTGLIDGYNVYRAVKGNNFTLITETPLPETAVSFIDATVQVETVYEYRITSRNSAGEESALFDMEEDTVLVVSSAEATTAIEWKTIGTDNAEVSINDTVSIIVNYTNPTRINTNILWYVSTTDSLVKEIEVSSLSGSDTLVFNWKDTGNSTIIVKIFDEAKTEWIDSLHISIVSDIPIVNISGSTAIPINTPVTFTAGVSQEFGTITKYLWDNGMYPGWDDSTGSSYTVAFQAETTVTVTLAVMDDDGNIGSAVKEVVITNDAPVATGLEDLTISINDTIYFSLNASDNNGIKTILWDFGDSGDLQFDTTIKPANYHVFPSEPMQCTVTVMVVDSFDKATTTTANIDVLLDPPIASIQSQTTIAPDSILFLSVAQCTPGEFGTIAKYEWSIGSYTDFTTRSGDTVITPPLGNGISLIAVLRITDDDNNIAVDTVEIFIGPDWSQATDAAPFSGRFCLAGTSFNERLWVIGGRNEDTYLNDVWSSEDGITWTCVTETASFSPRDRHSVVVFQERLWVIGGGQGGQDTRLNDVWWSEDGSTWTEATSEADFSPRYDFGTVVFKDKLWVLSGGGFGPMDVWWSEDGVSWTQENDMPFKPTSGNAFTVFDGKIWAIGGHDEEALNHIWYSSDGTSWIKVTDNAPFSKRSGQSTVVLNGRLYLIGGYDMNDIWCSGNGKNWVQTRNNSIFQLRNGFGCTVFNDMIWVIAGYTRNNDEHTMMSDVWHTLK